MVEHPGRAFHDETCYRRETIGLGRVGWREKPPSYKLYPNAPLVPLPAPGPTSGDEPRLDLWTCVLRRRSVRAFAATPLSLLDLSRLLWASAGMTASFATSQGRNFLRAAPSAGALYPIETYVVANRVDQLEPGLYHYRVAGTDISQRPLAEGSHILEQLKTEDLRSQMAEAALDQPMCGKAGAIFVWTAVFGRSEWKYGERAYRYIYLDAGHVAAHLALAAVAQGLGGCPVAAFYDDEANAILGIDGKEEAVIYMMAVGIPARTPTADRPVPELFTAR